MNQAKPTVEWPVTDIDEVLELLHITEAPEADMGCKDMAGLVSCSMGVHDA